MTTPLKKLAARSLTHALSAALLAGFLAPNTARAGGCMTADEAMAEEVRRLQTTLMVGALQCRSQPALRTAEIYNRFVQRHGAAIAAQNRIFTRYFQRTYGANHQSAMDSHITVLANTASRLGHMDGNFCARVTALGEATLTANGGLAETAHKNTLVAGTLKSCLPARAQTVDNRSSTAQ
ncbi:MAG: hypothetical protein ACOY99_11225 [Pseudomonadota bacterium]